MSQSLGEDVRDILLGRNVRDSDLHVLDALTDEEVTPSDVFGALVVLRVIREVARTRVVHAERSSASQLPSASSGSARFSSSSSFFPVRAVGR